MYSISREMDSNLAYLVKQLKILFVLEIKRRIFVLNFYFTSKITVICHVLGGTTIQNVNFCHGRLATNEL